MGVAPEPPKAKATAGPPTQASPTQATPPKATGAAAPAPPVPSMKATGNAVDIVSRTPAPASGYSTQATSKAASFGPTGPAKGYASMATSTIKEAWKTTPPASKPPSSRGGPSRRRTRTSPSPPARKKYERRRRKERGTRGEGRGAIPPSTPPADGFNRK